MVCAAKSLSPAVDLAAPLRCSGCPVRQTSICADCSTAELHQLDMIKAEWTFRPDQEIFAAGDPIDMVGNLVEGVVKVTKTLANGRRQIVGLLFPSDFVGRTMREHSEYDVIAATHVTLCLFQRRPFEALMQKTPNIERRLLQRTLNELDAARELLLLLGRKNAQQRVASFLCLLAERIGDTGPEGRRFRIPIGRDDMADYLGLTIETVSRQMSALRKSGVIDIEAVRHVVIKNAAALVDMSGDHLMDGAVACRR